MPKNLCCDTYDVQTIDGQVVEIMDDEAEALASAVLEEVLAGLEDKDKEAHLRAATVCVLQYIAGDWGYHEWKSLADKRKHQETTQ